MDSREPKPLVIVNPTAGGGRARHFWERCAAACGRAGQSVDVVWTSRRGDAAEMAAAAQDRLVVAVGGDGTAHEVVNGLVRSPRRVRPRFGALCAGTGSDLGRTLASPRRSQDVPAWLQRTTWRTIDVGRIGTSAGHRYFVNAADAGIGAEVARRAATGPAVLGGRVRFLGAAIFSLLTHRSATLSIRLDGGPWERTRVWSLVVANGRYFGGGMWIAPLAEPDDGSFDVVLIGDLGRVEGIWRMPLLYQGRHGTLRKVRFARASKVEVDAVESVGIEADGEVVGETPAVFEIVPRALDVIDWKGLL